MKQSKRFSMPTSLSPRHSTSVFSRYLLAVILLLSLLLLIHYSKEKFFWGDEVLTYYTIHGRSFAGLLRFQSSTPIVLEPPSYDLILLSTAKIFGYSITALRFPSIFFFVLSQALLFLLVKRAGGEGAALLAAALPLSCAYRSFGAETRPYGFLIAMSALALFAWMKTHGNQASRRVALAGIAAAIGLSSTGQFYGVLVAMPVFVAEVIWEMFQSRRVDWPVWIAVLAGLSCVALDLPFLKAVHPYQAHFIRESSIGSPAFWSTYRVGLHELPRRLKAIKHSESIAFTAFLVFSILTSFPRRVRGEQVQPEDSGMRISLWAAFVTMALTPIATLLIAYFVTKTYSPRHAIEFMNGAVALLSLSIAGLAARWRPSIGKVVLVCAGVAIAGLVVKWQRTLPALYREDTALLVDTPAVVDALQQYPSAPIYMTPEACFAFTEYGNPVYAPRVHCLYSPAGEMRYDHQVITTLTMEAMAQHTDFPLNIVSYKDMRSNTPAFLVDRPVPWMQWLPNSLKADSAALQPVGTGLGGFVETVSFPATDNSATTDLLTHHELPPTSMR